MLVIVMDYDIEKVHFINSEKKKACIRQIFYILKCVVKTATNVTIPGKVLRYNTIFQMYLDTEMQILESISKVLRDILVSRYCPGLPLCYNSLVLNLLKNTFRNLPVFVGMPFSVSFLVLYSHPLRVCVAVTVSHL